MMFNYQLFGGNEPCACSNVLSISSFLNKIGLEFILLYCMTAVYFGLRLQRSCEISDDSMLQRFGYPGMKQNFEFESYTSRVSSSTVICFSPNLKVIAFVA